MKRIKKKNHKNKKKDAVQRAIDYGIDVTLLYENLTRTPTERIENFLKWLQFAYELRKANEKG